MLTFLAKRLLQLIPTLFFVSVLIFSLQQLLPGDPAMIMAGEDRDPAVIEQIRKQYRLDQPIPVQYVYLGQGRAHRRSRRVDAQQAEGARPRAAEAPRDDAACLMAFIIALSIGITAGIISAVMKDTVWDYAANVFALWGLSTPNFWLGIMLIFLFSVQLGWLPPSGYVPLTEDWKQSLAHHHHAGLRARQRDRRVLMRHTRSAMLQALNSDYVRTARAKGLLERSVILKHAMRNALTPVITLGALESRHAAVGRGADRADLHHSGLRQADHRRGVQPRLRGGAGRRAGHGDDLHRAQPAWPTCSTCWSIRG